MFRYSIRPYFFRPRPLLAPTFRRLLNYPFIINLFMAFPRFANPPKTVFGFLRVLPFYMHLRLSLDSWNHENFGRFHWLYRHLLLLLVYHLVARRISLILYYLDRAFIYSQYPIGYVRPAYLRNRTWTNKWYLIFKRTHTNNYLTLTNKHGEVLYAISAGMLGIRKTWERHKVPAFIRMVDRCLFFMRKRKLTRTLACIVTSSNKKHMNTIMARARRYRFKVRFCRWIPKSVHGGRMRRKRVKRL